MVARLCLFDQNSQWLCSCRLKSPHGWSPPFAFWAMFRVAGGRSLVAGFWWLLAGFWRLVAGNYKVEGSGFKECGSGNAEKGTSVVLNTHFPIRHSHFRIQIPLFSWGSISQIDLNPSHYLTNQLFNYSTHPGLLTSKPFTIHPKLIAFFSP